MVAILDNRIWFPDPGDADGEGLVAVGGDMLPERLLAAYRQGIFPWSATPVTWWSPDPRGVIEFDEFHISQSLAKVIRSGEFKQTRDKAFREVITACAASGPKREATWISPEFIQAYCQLHELGHAHSVECWQGETLVGGVYGVMVGGVFAAESMFYRADNASKVALCHLVEHLRSRGFDLLDIQMVTPATRPLGARNIPRHEYLDRLGRAVQKHCIF